VTGNKFGLDPGSIAIAGGADAFTVVWNSPELGNPGPTQPIPPDVFARRYDDELQAVGTRIAVTAEPDRQQHHSGVAPLADGGFIVVWQNDALDNGTGENR